MLSRRVALLALFSVVALIVQQGTLLGQGLEKPTVKDNVSIQLPVGWGVGANGIVSAQTPQPDKDPTGSFQASLLIKKERGTKVDASAEQATVARTFLGYQVTEKPENYATKSGLQGVMFSGTYKIGLTALRSRQYMFIVNGQIYTITFTCLNSRWGVYQGLIDDCLATLTIK